MTPEEANRRLKSRNQMLAVALGAFAVLFFVLTIVKLGSNVITGRF
jgi:hypothetical protein